MVKRTKTLKKKYLSHLLSIFGDVCWYCGISLKNRHRHIDHIKPVRLGGSNDLDNLALSCKFCNFAKWYSYLDEFYDWLNHIKSSHFKPKIHIKDDFHPTSNFYLKDE